MLGEDTNRKRMWSYSVTVTSDLNPIVGDAHLGLASAVFAVVVVNAVMVRNLRLSHAVLRQ